MALGAANFDVTCLTYRTFIRTVSSFQAAPAPTFTSDNREQPVIAALEDLVKAGNIELIIPQIIIDEFERNKARVAEETRRSLHSHFQLVREAVNRFGEHASKSDTIKPLNEVDHAIVVKGDAVNDSIKRIEALLKSSPPRPLTDAIKQHVTERAIAGKAPYHRGKNNVADAIIIETYTEVLSSMPDRNRTSAFVTHNTKDFSDVNGDRHAPHTDLATLIAAPASIYRGSMVDLIKEIAPDLLADHDFEFNYAEQPRRLSEILEAEHLLFRQVWYSRHWNLRANIEAGTCNEVAEKDYSRNPYRSDQILDTVWANDPVIKETRFAKCARRLKMGVWGEPEVRLFESMVQRSQAVCGTYPSRRLDDRLGLLLAEFLSA